MILYHKKIMVSPLTTHIRYKIQLVSNKYFLYNQIYNLHNTLKDLILKTQNINLCLNPHAGENGVLGNEEESHHTNYKKIK